MGQTILIVEDEIEIADTIKYALEIECFSVVWVTTGRDAIQALAETPIVLIILDVGLPDINGFELLKKIRLQSDIPVIFLTARNNEIDRVVGLEIGADDYVAKPFSPRELVTRVKVVLRRLVGSEIEKDDLFQTDLNKAQIRFCGQPLLLTKAEFLLLSTILERPGQVFSRGQLMNRMWEHPRPSDERTVDTHVKAIRAKLRDINAGIDPIKTHRGLGYSIER